MNKASCANSLFHRLNNNDIQYCVLEIDEKTQMIDLFVHLDDLVKFAKVLASLEYKKTGSTAEKYSFIYCLEPDSFWENKQSQRIHSASQMFCSSLSNLSKSKLPLDNMIQESLWRNKSWNAEKQYWEISREDYLIYLLVNCVFNQNFFDDVSKNKIAQLADLLSSPTLAHKLEGVFFKYTPTLIELVKERKFEDIFRKYKSFCDY